MLRTVDDHSNDKIENHKNHDENINIVPKVGTDSVVKPYLRQNIKMELTFWKKTELYYIHE
jgi:hypothetical protein